MMNPTIWKKPKITFSVKLYVDFRNNGNSTYIFFQWCSGLVNRKVFGSFFPIPFHNDLWNSKRTKVTIFIMFYFILHVVSEISQILGSYKLGRSLTS